MKNQATIEQLAERLNGKLWVKGDLKRIYLNEGYNTKKMSTKTFVCEDNGEFKVSCCIECPSQTQSWIDNERERVIESVEKKIDEAIATSYFYIKSANGKAIDDCGNEVELGALYVGSDIFAKKGSANGLKRREDLEGEVVEISRDDFEVAEKAYSEQQAKERETNKVEALPIAVKKEYSPTPDADMSIYVVGSKWRNRTFGIGEVISVEGNKVSLKFEAGVKSLLAKFAGLTPAE